MSISQNEEDKYLEKIYFIILVSVYLTKINCGLY